MEYDDFIKSKEKKHIEAGFDIDCDHAFLFDFQKSLVRWSLKRGRAGLFCDTGLGKTAMQLSWAKKVNEHTKMPVIIFAPLAVSHQTVREGGKYGIDVSYFRDQPDNNFNGIAITNYEMIDNFDMGKFSGLVLDESSILKSYTSKTRDKILEISSKVPYKLSCTATPSPNDFMELGNQAEFLGVMSRAEMLAMYFIHDGGETSKWRLKGHGQKKFWKWLATWAAVVRMPSDIGFSDDGYILPELNIIHHITESKTYDSLFASAAQGLNEQRKAKRNSIDERIGAVSDMVNDSDESFLIWCTLNDESDLLAKRINDSIEVRGSMSIDLKEAALDSFSNNETKRLISKTSICGFGMNWQHCNNVVFSSIDNSFESYYQAIRRCWRFGQKKQVNVHLFLSEEELGVLENLKRKEHQHNEYSKRMVNHMKEFMKEEIFGLKQEKSEYKREKITNDEYEIHLSDCVDLAKDIDSESIDYSIFSPPFASLYTYSNSDRDMGNCSDNDEFFIHFGYLVDELFRIIKSGRLVSVHCTNLPTSKQNDGFIGLKDFRGDIIRLFQNSGFIYHSEVCIWKDPVTAMQRTKALGLLHKTIRKDSSMCRQGVPDYLVTFRKPGDNANPIQHYRDEKECKSKDRDYTKIFPVEIWQKYASPVWFDINPSKTLQFRSAKEDDDERHICPLQLEVIERGVNLWSNKNDLIFSPFMGIGSEGYVAIKKGRRFIGSELKKSYFDLAVKNMDFAITESKQLTLFEDM